MAVLKNKTQNNFTMISNNVLRDKRLSLKDRGLLCTLYGLPDNWEFSLAGLSKLVPDGVDGIRASMVKLENVGYVHRNVSRGKSGKYISEIEVYTESKSCKVTKQHCNHMGITNTAEPIRSSQHGSANEVNPTQYNNLNIKSKYKNKDNKSINQSNQKNSVMDGEMDEDGEYEKYKSIIADNIKYD